MSQPEQCPTSKKAGLPAAREVPTLDRSAATGKSYWRSLDHVAGTAEFRDFVQREFPALASELLDGSRRHFLRLMGASMALAGLATVPGCRRPDHKILAYNKDPEHIVIGKPLYYATSMPLPGGGCEGLLAETFEGRPTKLEGNPLHPANLGKSGVWSQASILELYDVDRDPEMIAQFAGMAEGGVRPLGAAAFGAFASEHFGAFDADQGATLAFLVDKATSPSRDDLRNRILARWPQARWYAYETVDDENAAEGSRLAFGGVYREIRSLENADVIVSLDCDFLGEAGCSLRDARGFAASRVRPGTREGHEAAETEMSRVYVAESSMTLTGAQADHRLALKPSAVAAAAVLLARKLAQRLGGPMEPAGGALGAIGVDEAAAGAVPEAWLEAAGDDLAQHRGRCIVMAGPNLPPAAHALVHAMNAALGNVGKTVEYRPAGMDASRSSAESMRSLVRDIDGGAVRTLVVIGGNPVFDAPADLGFGEQYARVAARIHIGQANETSAASTHFVQRSHYLESWSDAESIDGTYGVIQPMIKPLWDTMSDLEALAAILGDGVTDAYEVVRRTMRSRLGQEGGAFERTWKRALHDGRLPGTTGSANAADPTLDAARIASALRSAAAGLSGADGGIEVVFQASPHVHDGRFANNGWLQELPDPITKVAWDNPAMVSPATAKRLGVAMDRHAKTPQYNHAPVATITIDGRSIEIPVWVVPGMPDDTIVLRVGYGRKTCGRVGAGTGFDVYPIRTSGGARVARGATVERKRGADPVLMACTQDHWTMEGRGVVREVDLAAWREHGDRFYETRDHYDETRRLTFGGQLGMESHTPANRDSYQKDQSRPYTYVKHAENGEIVYTDAAKRRPLPAENKHGRPYQQWGMSIDLTTCSGCGACTVACQAENNIPIVGKMETAKGREMHWIRVDRYFGAPDDGHQDHTAGRDGPAGSEVDVFIQPMACVHCEAAPCEVVCPVNATEHGNEGLNEMAYNRCIGTRYCSNNCPYKVRRFNWFDYGTKQYKGGFGQLGEALPEGLLPSNQNFVPPRLREPLAPVERMQRNPHVTVRSRGVMEKCTYCIQRINLARVETKLHDLDYIPDGFFQTACQQACPTGAIVFGDIYDYRSDGGAGSRVGMLRRDGRSYALLAYLNTRPRTTYLVRLRNPNPALRAPVEDPFHHVPGDHDGHDGHGADGGHARLNGRGEVRRMSLPILNGAQRTGARA